MANSLKDMLSSVDWGKMLSSADTRNALVGSALGAALLGGAGLMQKRDPEESRFAPIGDALTGALLGGVAGYGLPKGLALFRNPGSLSPDGDTLKSNYLGWGLGGAAAGAGLFGASLYKTLDRASNRIMSANTAAEQAKQIDQLKDNIRIARRNGSFQDARLMEDALAWLDRKGGGYDRVLSRHRRLMLQLIHRGEFRGAADVYKRLSEIRGRANKIQRGYSGLSDLLLQAADEPIKIGPTPGDVAGKPMGLVRSLLTGKFRGKVPGAYATHGAHYARRAPWWRFWSPVGPRGHAMARGGKYAALGLLLGLGAHKFLGPTPSDNYRN